MSAEEAASAANGEVEDAVEAKSEEVKAQTSESAARDKGGERGGEGGEGGDGDDGGEGGEGGDELPSLFVGRRIRYRFVCSPPAGYVPSELDARSLPLRFFLDLAGEQRSVFSLQPHSDGAGARAAPANALPRRGPAGTHACDRLLFSGAVARAMEARGEAPPPPRGAQPPKKRFRTEFGHVVGPQGLWQIRNLPVRDPSPPRRPPPP